MFLLEPPQTLSSYTPNVYKVRILPNILLNSTSTIFPFLLVFISENGSGNVLRVRTLNFSAPISLSNLNSDIDFQAIDFDVKRFSDLASVMVAVSNFSHSGMYEVKFSDMGSDPAVINFKITPHATANITWDYTKVVIDPSTLGDKSHTGYCLSYGAMGANPYSEAMFYRIECMGYAYTLDGIKTFAYAAVTNGILESESMDFDGSSHLCFGVSYRDVTALNASRYYARCGLPALTLSTALSFSPPPSPPLPPLVHLDLLAFPPCRPHFYPFSSCSSPLISFLTL